VVPSCVFAGIGGYYASKQSGLAGVFRRAADGSDWKHALSEIEAFTVFVHPRDPSLVFAGTADGVYRTTNRGQNFRRGDFPDRGVQVWSFLQDDADPKWMLAGGSPVSIYRSEDAGASWKCMPDPQLPIHAKMPFSCRVMRFAPHPRRRREIFAVLEVSGVMRSTDGGESWSDCSVDLLRLAEAEPRLRSKLVSDTEAEGMLDGHAVCTSSADPDSIIIAVRMGLFRSKDQGKTWQDIRVDRFSPFTYGRDIKVSPQDPNTLYACLSVAASSKDGALYRSPPNSLLTGKITGNFAESGHPRRFSCLINGRIQWLTAKFATQRNREFPNAYQGIFNEEQGNCNQATAKPPNCDPTRCCAVSAVLPATELMRRNELTLG